MPPDLALLSTLIGSNYPCLELIFMVPKVFEPLKFDYSYIEVMNFVSELCEYPLHNVCNICAIKLTSATDTVMCLNIGTPTSNKFSTCSKYKNNYYF